MAFKQKRDFGHYSEIRQGILKKIKNVYDDDFNENIVKIFISHQKINMTQKILKIFYVTFFHV